MKDVINVVKPTIKSRIVLWGNLSGENKGKKSRKEKCETKGKIMKRKIIKLYMLVGK